MQLASIGIRLGTTASAISMTGSSGKIEMDEPTAWEEINPAMALVARPALPSLSSDLTPATPTEFRNELTACLALVAPTGMAEDDRQEWLRVAWATLGQLPVDLLSLGCRKARESCDHPSKVVPAILAAAAPMFNRRKEGHRANLTALQPPTRHVMDRRGEAMSEADTAELNRILEALGATARYRPDGSRYKVEGAASAKHADDHRPRRPTRQDYIALGVDPAVLDALPPPAE
jgi:hypothetical protein